MMSAKQKPKNESCEQGLGNRVNGYVSFGILPPYFCDPIFLREKTFTRMTKQFIIAES